MKTSLRLLNATHPLFQPSPSDGSNAPADYVRELERRIAALEARHQMPGGIVRAGITGGGTESERVADIAHATRHGTGRDWSKAATDRPQIRVHPSAIGRQPHDLEIVAGELRAIDRALSDPSGWERARDAAQIAIDSHLNAAYHPIDQMKRQPGPGISAERPHVIRW